MKEFFRKKIVYLKRNPQFITLLILIATSCIFLFALGAHSDDATGAYAEDYLSGWAATPDGQKYGGVVPAIFRLPGLYVFILTLFSVLSVISYLSVYKRGKLNVFMLATTFFMLAVMVACDILYVQALRFYVDSYGSKVLLDAGEVNGVQDSINNATAHLIANIVAIVFVAIVPLIRKLLNLIDTSVEDDYDKLMESKTEEELLIIDINEQA